MKYQEKLFSRRLFAVKPALKLLAGFALLALTACGDSGSDEVPPEHSFAQQAYLKALNADAFDVFGNSVALDGDTLVVGASNEQGDASSTADNPNNNIPQGDDSSAGAVYVFTRSNGVWSLQAYLKASNAGAEDGFGNSVALSGDTLAVGAYYEGGDASSSAASPNDNAPFAGAVYVFTRSGTSWSQQAYLKASNAGAGDEFGRSVALEGDTLAVAAPQEDGDVNSTAASPNDNVQDAGAVYIFTRTGTSWSQQAYLKASNAGTTLDRFGGSVALDGDTLAVGASGEDGDANSTAADPNDNGFNTGAVYVFTGSGTSWSQQAYLKASNAGGSDAFGGSVTLEGDTLAVGASGEAGDADSTAANPNDNASATGAVYVFTGSGANWTQQAYLKASNAGASDRFGLSLALSGNTLAVGTYIEAGDADSTAANPNDNASSAGAVYLFTRSGANWSQQAYLKASNAETGDEFGLSVALSGDTLAVGADGEDGDASSTAASPNDNAPLAGAVYVFQ
ncbi:MAG: FG-GAP repeat protein [Gammaproteobacteria bacterium]|nr:FG-GAP repeat protein [Gammaproteobacteria bacterium]